MEGFAQPPPEEGMQRTLRPAAWAAQTRGAIDQTAGEVAQRGVYKSIDEEQQP